MRRMWWTYREWCGRWPTLGVDEWQRRTLVVPWPWTRRIDSDEGWALHRAVTIVVGPWWATREVRRASYRRWVHWTRALVAELRDASEDDVDRVYARFVAAHGTEPDPHWS